MSDEIKINLPPNLDKSTAAKIKEALEYNRIIEETKKDLHENPRYKEFFDQYNTYSVNSFINTYAGDKARYLRYGELYKKRSEEKQLKYSQLASDLIWIIQQKKLFDLQYLWRAGKIKIPGIQITYDFNYWEDNIHAASFIEPITEDEIELLKEFILSDDSVLREIEATSWQDYESFKETYNDDDISLPDWYSFYDMRKGTGALLNLPDYMNEMENHYNSIYINKVRSAVEDKEQIADIRSAPSDARPYLPFKWEFKYDFIKRFENISLQSTVTLLRPAMQGGTP
jgi:hypothetical protein